MSPDRLPKPIIRYKNGTTVGHILVDSGASVSLINENALTAANHVKAGLRTRSYKGAGDETLPLGDYLVNVTVEIPNMGKICIKNAVVCKGRRANAKILMGTPDIQRLGLILNYQNNTIKITRGPLRNKMIKMPTIRSLLQEDNAFEIVDNNRSYTKLSESIQSMFETLICMVSDENPVNQIENFNNLSDSESLPVNHEPSKGSGSSNTILSVDKNSELLKNSECIDNLAAVKNETLNVTNLNHKIEHLMPKNFKSKEDPDQIQDPHKIESSNDSIITVLGDPCIKNTDPNVFKPCQGCDNCVDPELKEILKRSDEPPALNNPKIDRKSALLAYIERIRQRDKNTFTHKECTIPDKVRKNDPDLAAAIEKLLEKHKRIFGNDIGCLGPEFEVKGHIKPNSKLSVQRPGHSNLQDDRLTAAMKQFAILAAHKVIVPVHEAGIEPINNLMVLPVLKKDEDGNILNILNALRIVIDSRPVNGQTGFCGSPTDNINDAINFAAKTSKIGLNAKVDFRKAYFNIPLHKSLWPYFCITIPILGTYCFTRVVQGWAPAAQICQETLTRIFFVLKDYLRKYMDDVILAAPNCRLKYLRILDQFFHICSKNDLRLSGSKCFFCVTEFKYLGSHISNGIIEASPHYVFKMQSVTTDKIINKKDLKSYVASFRYIARFRFRSTDLLKSLNDASIGESNEKIKWTPFLENEFQKVQKALKELSKLYPFEPSATTVLVVDTSKTATGGFMYQISAGEPRLIMFFSRTRRDKERKTPISSCHMEMMGLKAMVYAFIEMLRQCTEPITVVTDSRSVVKVFEKYRKNIMPSEDIVLNNALYAIVSLIDVNVIHAKNTNPNIQFSDAMSRLGLFINENTCEGTPKCSICAAADPDNHDSGIVLNAIQDSVRLSRDHGHILQSDQIDHIYFPRDYETFGPISKRKYIRYIFNLNLKSEKAKLLKLKLPELLDNSGLLIELQIEDKILKKLKRDLENGILSYPQKDRRLQTLLETRNARLERGVIKIDKFIDGIVYRVIPIPSHFSIYAISAVHNTIGHSPITQLQKHVNRYFQFDHLKEHVKEFAQNCAKCVLLRAKSGFKSAEQKPVPVPDRFYTHVLVDEVTRTVRGKNFKFFVAIEALSGFMVCLAYDKPMKSELFVHLLAQIKTILCPHQMDGIKMTVRCDRATWHTSTAMTTTLKMLNIELQLYHSNTLSKNIIPELDSRIKIYSQYFIQIVENSPFDLTVCMNLAAVKTNNSIGKLGFTPAELFVNRRWDNDDQIVISTQNLIKTLKERRLARRLYESRKLAEKFQQKEMKFIPYENDELNSPFVNLPGIVKLRPGDLVTLQESFDKNEPSYNYEVLKIDFKSKLLQIRRQSMLDIDVPKPIWVSFKILKDIIPKDHINHICSYNNFDYDVQAHRSLPNDDDVIAYNNFLTGLLKIEPVLTAEVSNPFHLSINELQNETKRTNIFQGLKSFSLENEE